VQYLDFLGQLHERVRPESYLEIGVRGGHSIARSTVTSVGVDPAYDIAPALTLGDGVTLVQQTSDDFFDGDAPVAGLPNERVDLAFIDGMHLYEFVLRDFINVERWTRPGAVIVFDDILPRSSREAQRDRQSSAWTGDVWKIVPTLRRLRPDLMTIQVGTQPTGLLLVLGSDASSTVLPEHYDELVASWVRPDHVPPPKQLVNRRQAVRPEVVLDAPFWTTIDRLRTGAVDGPDLRKAVKDWTAAELLPRQARGVNSSFGPPPAAPAPTPWSVGRVARGIRRRLSGIRGHG
jgi:predicted O-methyltransferase YrrM